MGELVNRHLQPGKYGNLNDLYGRRWGAFVSSGMFAILLTLAMFLLMPHLIDSRTSAPSVEMLVPDINVIRVKKKESEVRRETTKQPDPPKNKPVLKPHAFSTQSLKTKLTLPFKINPHLPDGPDTLNLPTIENTPVAYADIGLQEMYSVDELDSPLTVLSRIPPIYPMRARRRGIEGWVKVSFIVDKKGHVNDIAIIESRPPGLFDQSVEHCVCAWRFKPGKVEGMPVKTKVETTIRFELE